MYVPVKIRLFSIWLAVGPVAMKKNNLYTANQIASLHISANESDLMYNATEGFFSIGLTKKTVILKQVQIN